MWERVTNEWAKIQDYRISTKEFLDRVKQRFTASALQAWAAKLLDVHRESDASIDLYGLQVPEFIRGIDPPYTPRVIVLSGRLKPPAPCVLIDFGGGFGHWGLIIGADGFRPPEDWNYLIEWKPGVYVYHSRF
jgi:hypothetical protein